MRTLTSPVKLVPWLVAMLSAPVLAAGAHDHGGGRLDVSIEKERITIELELPLDVLVGFERAPRNDKERAALAAAGKKLNDGAALFLPTAAAECRLTKTEVSLPFAEGTKTAATGEHADADARYEFECAQARNLAGIETTLFRDFSRLYRLELQRVGPVGQAGGRLTRKAPVVRW
ncbi:MAG: DUF2796 domain-containing protein [Rhodocyclaceae bacterium]|jgi:hypothetical protein|nr:DUF2796 domain-containing protein [Rhodocyclaceae bacterium]